MNEIPGHFNRELPVHLVKLPNGTLRDIHCNGTIVHEIGNDAGLTIGECAMCAEDFVYITNTNTWMTEKDFDLLLQDRAQEIGTVIRSL
jgi:hypothetical protein